MRWFTSDLHLGHTNIIKYTNRPFWTADQMNETLVDRWNAVVGTEDEVWVLGDVALGPILSNGSTATRFCCQATTTASGRG